MNFNAWFNALPAERQAILREDKWMLANAAFEAASTAGSTRIQELETELVSTKDHLADISRFEPNATDVERLRAALCNAGIAAPESQEELAYQWLSNVRSLMRSVTFLEEFRTKAVNDFANEVCGDVSTDRQRWLSGVADHYCKKISAGNNHPSIE